MFPKLFEYHWLTIHSYGFLLAAGFLAGLFVTARAGARSGFAKSKIYDLGLYIAVSSLVGSKLLLLITELDYYTRYPAEIFSLATLRSGGVYYGGFIVAVAVGIWLARRWGYPVWKTADVFAPGIALGQAIGRLGCFSAGCCYGRPTQCFLGVTFTNPYSQETVGVPLNTALHPTQLYEAAASLLIFGLLWKALEKKRFDGQVFILYLWLYSVVRFGIEFFRGDADRGFLFDGLLSTSQFISILLFILGIVLTIVLRRRGAGQRAG
ncbi:MAG: prolipoprotein diacylglyceryl transferase [Acidobacteriota bacterium]